MEESVNVAELKKVSLLDEIQSEFGLKMPDIKQYSPLTLAYIGDGIYDMIIRTVVVEGGNAPVNHLHRKVSTMVKASAQAELLHLIEPLLTSEELAVYKRGRNAKSFTSAKNASMTDYRTATGLEALMGYLYLTGDTVRAVELVRIGLDKK